MDDRMIIRLNIERFRQLLTAPDLDHKTRTIVEQLLAEAVAELDETSLPPSSLLWLADRRISAVLDRASDFVPDEVTTHK